MSLTRVQYDAWMDLDGPDQIVIPAIWEEEKLNPDTGWGGDSGEYEIPGEEPTGARVFRGDQRYMGRGFFLTPFIGEGGDCEGCGYGDPSEWDRMDGGA